MLTVILNLMNPPLTKVIRKAHNYHIFTIIETRIHLPLRVLKSYKFIWQKLTNAHLQE